MPAIDSTIDAILIIRNIVRRKTVSEIATIVMSIKLLCITHGAMLLIHSRGRINRGIKSE